MTWGVPQEPPEEAFATPKPKPRFKHDVPFRTAAVSRDGTMLVGLDADGMVLGWDTRTGRRLYGRPVLAKDDSPQRLTCSPDGRYLALSSRSLPASIMRVLRLATGEEVRRFERGFSPAFSPDGEILMATDGPQLRRWAMKSGAELPSLDPEAGDLQWAACSPKGDLMVASRAASSLVTAWDVATRRGRVVHGNAVGYLPATTSLAFAPDGKTLAVGNHWGIQYVNLSPEPDRTFEGHEEYASGPLQFSRDGRRMIAVCRRRRLLIWDLASGRQQFTWSAFNISEGILEISDGGDRVIWFDRGGLRVERIPEFLGGKDAGHEVKHVAFSPDGLALTVTDVGEVRFWDPATQKEVKRFSVPAGGLKFFGGDGNRIIFGCGSDSVRIWELPTGKELADISTTPYVGSVAFSPDGATLALGHADGALSLWDMAGKKERARIRLAMGGVCAISWSANGKSLAWGDNLGAVAIADGAEGRDPIQFKPRADQAIRELVFQKDGKTLWARNVRGVCWTYKDNVGDEPLRTESEEVHHPYDPLPDSRWLASGFQQRWGGLGLISKVFSPDGKYALTGTSLGTALIWEAPGEK